jgi:signal transduction histidine kinase
LSSITEKYFVVGDRIRIKQVVSNLIHNSIKSISRENDKKEGWISINIKKPKRKKVYQVGRSRAMIEVAIEDNEDGIDPKMIPNLFIKFSKSINGNGLELYISRKIIDAHGGKIWIDNNKKDGTIFRFSLPMLNYSLLF